VTVAAVDDRATNVPGNSGFQVCLDGKPARTPAGRALILPTRALAEAVAAEWAAQGEHIDAATMPLTRLVNSAMDGVAGRETEVRADIVKYGASDLVCYRAEGPEGLVHREDELWNPILDWAREKLGTCFAVGRGVMPVAQPDASQDGLARALAEYDGFQLAALHVMTALMGSALLALAHAHGQLSAAEAWAAAHVDEDWQISQWGEDAEAKARRDARWTEMQAASRMLELAAAP
jgi:chaperone required for assembly of F1-ATPase